MEAQDGHAMVPEEIPDEVQRFIRDHIDTVPHLEALLLMWESGPRAWTAEELAARLYVGIDTARRIQSDLARRQFLSSEASSEAYDPANEHDALLPLIARTYRRHLVPMARFIHTKGSTPMQEFSKAFRFKKDEG
jgi:hypothetical protein